MSMYEQNATGVGKRRSIEDIPKAGKNRLGLSLKESLGVAKVQRSEILTASMNKLTIWEKKVQKVRSSIAEHRIQVLLSNSRRVEMFTAMSEVYSPSSSGLKSSNALTQTLTVQLPGIINKGYKEPGARVNKVIVGGKVQRDYIPNTAPFLLDKFEDHIIQYVDKYLLTVVSLKDAFDKVDLLRRENDHYKKKVDSLTTKELKKNEKSGGNEQASEKLRRNRDKLNSALLSYTNSSNAVVLAVNDMCDEGWRELQPLVLKLVQFERTYCVVGNTVSTELGVEEGNIKYIGDEFKLSEAAGFKRLDSIVAKMVAAFSDKNPQAVPGVEAGSGPTGGLAMGTSFEGPRGRVGSGAAIPISKALAQPATAGGEEKKKSGWSMFGKKRNSNAKDGSGAPSQNNVGELKGGKFDNQFGSFNGKDVSPWAGVNPPVPVAAPTPPGAAVDFLAALSPPPTSAPVAARPIYSAKHQKEHWKQHKKLCVAPQKKMSAPVPPTPPFLQIRQRSDRVMSSLVDFLTFGAAMLAFQSTAWKAMVSDYDGTEKTEKLRDLVKRMERALGMENEVTFGALDQFGNVLLAM
ncbi:hypothetical protein TL16_g10621 [Triparma laevis f. inornata]|uniref:Uncharacterized protein n=1 Tax=Triparma laevis f. inornata TaxID=1714386 RepID=A0A9W7B9C6_9STRA|nr:hypothetical protein TL16_g10621 [Triparma laevis f. inornata]